MLRGFQSIVIRRRSLSTNIVREIQTKSNKESSKFPNHSQTIVSNSFQSTINKTKGIHFSKTQLENQQIIGQKFKLMSTSTSNSNENEQLASKILTFWFGNNPERKEMRQIWFRSNANFDEEIRSQFIDAVEKASKGELSDMANTPDGALALVILLDQFPRNLFRGNARMFATDEVAAKIAKEAIAKGFQTKMSELEKLFLYMPFQHSESLENQQIAMDFAAPLKTTSPGTYEFALKHFELVKKFGRFPHRNKILGRQNTPEEEKELQERPNPF